MLIGFLDGALCLLLVMLTLWCALALWYRLRLPRYGRFLAIACWLLAGAIWLLLVVKDALLGPLVGCWCSRPPCWPGGDT